MVRKAFQGRTFLRACIRFCPGTAYIVEDQTRGKPVSSGLIICSAKQVWYHLFPEPDPSISFFLSLCCVLCAVCKRNAKAGAAPNSSLRHLRCMLRLPGANPPYALCCSALMLWFAPPTVFMLRLPGANPPYALCCSALMLWFAPPTFFLLRLPQS